MKCLGNPTAKLKSAAGAGIEQILMAPTCVKDKRSNNTAQQASKPVMKSWCLRLRVGMSQDIGLFMVLVGISMQHLRVLLVRAFAIAAHRFCRFVGALKSGLPTFVFADVVFSQHFLVL